MDKELDINESDLDVETKDVPELLSAQFLRRVHQDKSILMQEYHDLLQYIEHPEIKKWAAESLLPMVEEVMTAVEELFAKHHAELPGLDGAMDAKDMEDEDTDIDADEVEEEFDGAVDETGADSTDDRDEDLPTEDEVVEGMQTKRLKMKRKSACSKCGKSGCNCEEKRLKSRKSLDKEVADTEKRLKYLKLKRKDQMSAMEATSADGDLAETTDAAHPKGLAQKALELEEIDKVSEVAKFLKDVSEVPDLEEEHRLKSYHYHKVLEPMSGLSPFDIKSLEDENDSDDMKSIPGGPEWLQEESAEHEHKMIHPHRKMCGKCSNFLKSLSTEKAFGELHRQDAANFAKEMEAAVSPEDAVVDDVEMKDGDVIEEVEEDVIEPGTMDTKDDDDMEKEEKSAKEEEEANKVKSVLMQQRKAMRDIVSKVNGLVKARQR